MDHKKDENRHVTGTRLATSSIMKLAGISQAILVTPYNPLILTDGSCLSRQFYGNYLDGSTVHSVLLPDIG